MKCVVFDSVKRGAPGVRVTEERRPLTIYRQLGWEEEEEEWEDEESETCALDWFLKIV